MSSPSELKSDDIIILDIKSIYFWKARKILRLLRIKSFIIIHIEKLTENYFKTKNSDTKRT